MRIVLWQNELAFHQAPHIRALAKLNNDEVLWIVQEEMSSIRMQQGWYIPGGGDASVIIDPNKSEISRLIHHRTEESIHIFSGISLCAMIRQAFNECLKTDARIGLLVETSDPDGINGYLRFLRGRFWAYKYGSRIAFILGIGKPAIEWYTLCKFPSASIFPYGYFPEVSCAEIYNPEMAGESDIFNVIYIGLCSYGKGVDLLISALTELCGQKWCLTIVGQGPYRLNLQKQVLVNKLENRVRFYPYMQHEQVLKLLVEQDLLVLPSRAKEGWGSVVNEALMCGVPAICSDRCGAQDLLQEEWRGETFATGNMLALKEGIDKRMHLGKPDIALRQRIHEWSMLYASGDVSARYLFQILNHVSGLCKRPVPPWFTLEMAKSIERGAL